MSKTRNLVFKWVARTIAVALAAAVSVGSQAARAPADPGVRSGASGAGDPLQGISADEAAFFQDGRARFVTTESVSGGKTMASDPGLTLIAVPPATCSLLSVVPAPRRTR
jgi:hypothetical protein